MECNSVLIGGLVSVSPNLTFWIAVIVLASILLRRGGGTAERFVIAGAGLKLLNNLFNIPAAAIVPWLISDGAGTEYAQSVATAFGIGRGVVSMAVIICLVYGFWAKFRAAAPANQETSP